jgi:hypothetical protein
LRKLKHCASIDWSQHFESETKKRKGDLSASLAAALDGRDSVDLAYQLNQRAFGLVREIAAAPGDWPLIGVHALFKRGRWPGSLITVC